MPPALTVLNNEIIQCTKCPRLVEYREAGLDLPILWPAMGVDSAREVIATFRQ